jgi:hypothetical protein
MSSSDGPATSRRAAETLMLPVCWPSSRSPAVPRRVGAPGLVMPPSSPSPCDEPLCSPAIEPRESCAGNEVRRHAASSHAPDLHVAALSERGEAARGLGTAMARARPRALHAWPSASRAARMAAATCLSSRVIHAPSSPSPRRTFGCANRGSSRAFPCRWERWAPCLDALVASGSSPANG